MSENKWCKHIEYIGSCAIYKEEKISIPVPTMFHGMELNFCPVCGKPRPGIKTDVERLVEKFREYIDCVGSDFSMERLAKIAIRFCRENKSKLHQSYDDFYAVNKRYPTSAEFIGLVSENMD